MAEPAAPAAGGALRRALADTLERQAGLVFAQPAIVARSSYGGQGLFRDRGAGESRPGYAPVEWWVLSGVEAENEIPRAGEGRSRLRLRDGSLAPLAEVLAEAGLVGEGAARWPLIKVLDIGGAPVPGVGRERERPPIPPHVHAGRALGGRLQGPGKRESYFFLPVDAPADEPEPVTRIGLRAGVDADELARAVETFGRSDAVYELLCEHPIRPRESWLVPDRIVHAPGPWPTVEMQTPQDDFHLLAWRLGERLEGEELRREREASLLRGLPDASALVAEGVELGARGRGPGVAALRRAASSASPAAGVRCTPAFVEPFRGACLELEAGARLRLPPSREPCALLVWSGRGRANGQRVDAADWDARECLLAGGHGLELEAASDAPLTAMRFEPLAAD